MPRVIVCNKSNQVSHSLQLHQIHELRRKDNSRTVSFPLFLKLSLGGIPDRLGLYEESWVVLDFVNTYSKINGSQSIFLNFRRHRNCNCKIFLTEWVIFSMPTNIMWIVLSWDKRGQLQHSTQFHYRWQAHSWVTTHQWIIFLVLTIQSRQSWLDWMLMHQICKKRLFVASHYITTLAWSKYESLFSQNPTWGSATTWGFQHIPLLPDE